MSLHRLVLLGVVFLAWRAAAEDWPMLGHDVARSGGTSTEVRPPFSRQWYRLFPDEGLQSGVQPVIAGGRVFLGTLGGVLHALDADTGQDVWTFKAAGPLLHAAAVAEGKVFFGCADGRIHAVNAANGQPVWSFRTGAAVWNAPADHVGAGVVLSGQRGAEQTPRRRPGPADIGHPPRGPEAFHAAGKRVTC